MKLMHKLLARNIGAIIQHLPNEAMKLYINLIINFDTICKITIPNCTFYIVYTICSQQCRTNTSLYYRGVGLDLRVCLEHEYTLVY